MIFFNLLLSFSSSSSFFFPIKIFLDIIVILPSHINFSHSVMSDSLRPHKLQHARPSCPSPTPGVHQTHVHQVSNAIQPSHPLSSPSPPALNLSQHQGFSNESALHIRWPKVLELQHQHQSFQ